jgi:hypothetical protein
VDRRANLTLVASALALLLVLSSCSNGASEFGILEGHVSIGPLVPVLREGEQPPTPSAEVYAARQIVVYEMDGKTEVTRLQIDGTGNFHAELPVGDYVVDINRAGMDSAANLPVAVEIVAGSPVRLDIDIDTGIR